jgi:predicted aspartyl protease
VSYVFNPYQGLIVVQAELWGPSGSGFVSLALDTGATSTMVDQTRLLQLGYNPALSPGRFQITTASGVEFVPRITLSKIAALGQERTSFHVVCHTLPPTANVDGLLGLDFFRGQTLTVDFRTGQIILR